MGKHILLDGPVQCLNTPSDYSDYEMPACIWGKYCDTSLNISGWIDTIEIEPYGTEVPYCQMFDKRLRRDHKKKNANGKFAVKRCAQCKKTWPVEKELK